MNYDASSAMSRNECQWERSNKIDRQINRSWLEHDRKIDTWVSAPVHQVLVSIWILEISALWICPQTHVPAAACQTHTPPSRGCWVDTEFQEGQDTSLSQTTLQTHAYTHTHTLLPKAKVTCHNRTIRFTAADRLIDQSASTTSHYSVSTATHIRLIKAQVQIQAILEHTGYTVV